MQQLQTLTVDCCWHTDKLPSATASELILEWEVGEARPEGPRAVGCGSWAKSVLVLVLQVWCCVVKHGLVTLGIIMILKDTTTFQISLYSVLGTSLLWRSTVAFTYLKVKSAKCLKFVYFQSCYFGLGLVSSGLGHWSKEFGHIYITDVHFKVFDLLVGAHSSFLSFIAV